MSSDIHEHYRSDRRSSHIENGQASMEGKGLRKQIRKQILSFQMYYANSNPLTKKYILFFETPCASPLFVHSNQQRLLRVKSVFKKSLKCHNMRSTDLVAHCENEGVAGKWKY